MEKSFINQNDELLQGQDVLIIGNGFDLDLGLKTSYSDFYQSKFWPFNNPSNRMGQYMQKERTNAKNWMDLEAKLGDYAYTGRNGRSPDGFQLPYFLDKEEDNVSDYELLTGRLRDYLTKAEDDEINQNSTAATVLLGNITSGALPCILSFNYTDLHKFAKKIGIQKEFNYYHVHGSLAHNDIILGVGENYTNNNIRHLSQNMDFLYKTSSPNYCPPAMAKVLNKATNVTFFGLSLGGMDAPYFSGLFQNLSSQIGKSITFFTYNNESRLQLLRHLRNVEDINLNDIFTRHSLKFICTSCQNDVSKVEKYLQNLKSTK